VSTVLLCLCGCQKADHKQGKKACGRCGVCDAFELDGEVPTSQLARERPFLTSVEVEAVDVEGESTSARLRRVEQQRDQAREMWETARDAHAATLAELDGVREQLKQMSGFRAEAIAACASVRDERDLARAELASARTELEHMRENDRIRARVVVERNAELASARQELDQLRAQLAAAHADTTNAVIAMTARAQVDALDRQHRFLCKACGARYGKPYPDHEHGPLTPVTVLIIEEQGAPPA
jgi:DNA repair exonuclease SbcCD ATPase subunit